MLPSFGIFNTKLSVKSQTRYVIYQTSELYYGDRFCFSNFSICSNRFNMIEDLLDRNDIIYIRRSRESQELIIGMKSGNHKDEEYLTRYIKREYRDNLNYFEVNLFKYPVLDIEIN